MCNANGCILLIFLSTEKNFSNILTEKELNLAIPHYKWSTALNERVTIVSGQRHACCRTSNNQPVYVRLCFDGTTEIAGVDIAGVIGSRKVCAHRKFSVIHLVGLLCCSYFWQMRTKRKLSCSL